jgi:pyridoxamine 5'-phosphate oxidase
MTAPDLYAEALATFDRLFDEAASAGEPDRTAMTVATAALDARPSARTVLLKAHDARGFTFYTHLDGRKGRELQANPHAALLFHWPRVRNGVQVRIEGMVDIVSDAEADAYFSTRPLDSRIGAWASAQSQPVASRAALEAQYAERAASFGVREGASDAVVPRPPHWGGYRIHAERVELWHSRPGRLHDREVYERLGGSWSRYLLYP